MRPSTFGSLCSRSQPGPCGLWSGSPLNDEFQGKGIGSALLRYAFTLGLEMSVKFGCTGILVDAKASAVSFYSGFGFEPCSVVMGQSVEKPEPVLVFLPLDRVRDAIDENT